MGTEAHLSTLTWKFITSESTAQKCMNKISASKEVGIVIVIMIIVAMIIMKKRRRIP